jgi:hypothetical protein
VRAEASLAKTAGVLWRSSSMLSVRANAWAYAGAMDSEIEKVFIWMSFEDLDSSAACRRPEILTPQRRRATAEHRELVSAIGREALRARTA